MQSKLLFIAAVAATLLAAACGSSVTYAGHPLYYFVQDKQQGDATGQGVSGFGGLRWVVSPSGAAIH